jgi:hypothetical protein
MAVAAAVEDIVDIADILGHFLHHNSLDLHLAAARRSLAAGSLGLGCCNLGYSRTGLGLLRSRSCWSCPQKSLDEGDAVNSVGRYELTRSLLV